MFFCISTARFSVLVNGEHAGIFSSSRGLHQGDTLSHFLFTMVMEYFSKLVTISVEISLIDGFSISNAHSQQLVISHLLFAYDNLIICNPDERNLGFLLSSKVWVFFNVPC